MANNKQNTVGISLSPEHRAEAAAAANAHHIPLATFLKSIILGWLAENRP